MPEIHFDKGAFVTTTSLSPESQEKGLSPRELARYPFGSTDLNKIVEYISKRMKDSETPMSPAEILNFLIDNPQQAIKYQLPRKGLR